MPEQTPRILLLPDAVAASPSRDLARAVLNRATPRAARLEDDTVALLSFDFNLAACGSAAPQARAPAGG